MSRYALSDNADEYRPARVREEVWEDFKAGLKALDNAAQDIAKAGRLFADISEPQWDKLVASAPSPMRRTLKYTRDVGKGILLPQLATASGSYVSRLRSFPVIDQERLLTEPIEVAVTTTSGKSDKKLVRVPDMEPEEVRQVFVKQGREWKQRSVQEQRAWLQMKAKKDERKPAMTEIKRPGRWTIKGGRVFLAASKVSNGLTASDLEAMKKDLKL